MILPLLVDLAPWGKNRAQQQPEAVEDSGSTQVPPQHEVILTWLQQGLTSALAASGLTDVVSIRIIEAPAGSSSSHHCFHPTVVFPDEGGREVVVTNMTHVNMGACLRGTGQTSCR